MNVLQAHAQAPMYRRRFTYASGTLTLLGTAVALDNHARNRALKLVVSASDLQEIPAPMSGDFRCWCIPYRTGDGRLFSMNVWGPRGEAEAHARNLGLDFDGSYLDSVYPVTAETVVDDYEAAQVWLFSGFSDIWLFPDHRAVPLQNRPPYIGYYESQGMRAQLPELVNRLTNLGFKQLPSEDDDHQCFCAEYPRFDIDIVFELRKGALLTTVFFKGH